MVMIGFAYFANRSHVSITSFMPWEIGFILDHMTVSSGFLVRSFLSDWLGMSPAAMSERVSF
jgi:hypothetical protein